MKKLKVILSAVLLTALFAACKNPAGNVPENKPGNSTDSENASSEPAAPVDSEQGEESSVVGSNPFPGSLIATDKGIKLTINVPENMLKVEVSRLSDTESINDAGVLIFTQKNNTLNTYSSETLVYEDSFVNPGVTYKYRVRFVTSDIRYLPFCDWTSVTTTAGSGELKMTNKERVLGSFDKKTLVYKANETPEYTYRDDLEIEKWAVLITHDDDYSNWIEGWVRVFDDNTEYTLFRGFRHQFENLPVRRVVLKARVFFYELPENQSFELEMQDNTTVFEESFRWDNSKGEIWSAVPTDNGVELKIHIPYGIGRLQVFRKTPGSADYSFYSNVENWNNEKQKLELLPNYFATFVDPYVTPDKEYSYKVRFVTPDWNYSSFTEAVTVTSTTGNGELKLLNEPEGILDKVNKKFTFTKKPEFSNVGGNVQTNMIVQYQKPEWTGWSDFSFWINPQSDEVDIMLFGLDNGQCDKLNVQLGINGTVYGWCMVGDENYGVSYNASNWFFKLKNGFFEWKIEEEFPIDVGSDNGTTVNKDGELYNFSFSGTGQYNGLFTGINRETGKTVGVFFIKKAGFPYKKNPSSSSYQTASENASCIVTVEKQNDGSWSFTGYRYAEEVASLLTYNQDTDNWTLNKGGTVLNRSGLSSITASWSNW
ncbi:MAG: hypothetical protein MJ185_00795 [Treponema sp.]|nr:hypothetical protein [Treponema sp.]